MVIKDEDFGHTFLSRRAFVVEVLSYDLGSLLKIKFDSFQKVAVGLFQSRCTFKNWVTFFDLGALKRSRYQF